MDVSTVDPALDISVARTRTRAQRAVPIHVQSEEILTRSPEIRGVLGDDLEDPE
ncbi:hypothetical protein [Nannocystis punicea]|uniref:Prevent-host-death family protein n=1 Tax=Nannocystis punicea TaxID=2995304 RepID=A0ABY7GUC3_9BACT|nr:hypothetical protein [Nannocystis poenicansa]WAS90529.1 hypothetical protein O0S08_30445 [Nannocystis poenicansa]